MKFIKKSLINKGWSSDKKYDVIAEDGTRYLYRVSDASQYDKKLSEFNMMKQVANGYFENNVSMKFWKLLALYISSNTLSSIPWAIPFGQGEIDTMVNQAKEVLEWYDNMQNPVPNWYKGIK